LSEPPVADLLRIDNLSKKFGSLRAIDGLSLSLRRGEALGIIGPNGAGKSTLFNLIAGELAPTAGAIHFDGHNITGVRPFRRCRMGIGRTYQIPRPFGRMTVFENLLVAASFASGRAESACRAGCIDVLRKTGLLNKADSLAGHLTLLERKRLELARAMAVRPRLLLLDEIGGGLIDSEIQVLVETIKKVMEDGVSIVWIEHIVHALLAVVSRLYVMNFGRQLAEGTPTEVMANPLVQEIYMGIEAE
jgi:branched-chain amino acid transport system ATP-binding protein